MGNNRKNLISIIIPVYNEEEMILPLYNRLKETLDEHDIVYELVFVNDGSDDQTNKLIEQLIENDNKVVLVNLSRNYGKEIAMTAGFDYAQGDAAITLDADLQDPPELIPSLIEKWEEGYDVVYATRISRHGESLLRRVTAKVFYLLLQKSTNIYMPRDTGDYRLLSRRALNALNSLRERNRFMKGLYSWIGYKQIGIPYHRDIRYAGSSKWNYWKLWNFALEGLTSFTTMPLKLATYIGVLTSFGAFAFGVFVIVKTMLYGEKVAGYPSLMVTMLFLGGVQLIALGVIGEYLGRISDESKQRPLYIVSEYIAKNQMLEKQDSGKHLV